MIVAPHTNSPGIEPLNSTNALSLTLSVVNFCSVKNKQAD